MTKVTEFPLARAKNREVLDRTRVARSVGFQVPWVGVRARVVQIKQESLRAREEALGVKQESLRAREDSQASRSRTGDRPGSR